jgi:uncharacterized protein YacL
MKSKIYNALLLLTSLLGYLEWSGGNHIFLLQAEAEIISKLLQGSTSVVHPFTLLPLLGQILLLITLFQQKTSKILTYISIGGLGLLLGFMFAIGLMVLNFKILLSTIPFLVTAILTVRYYRSESHRQP